MKPPVLLLLFLTGCATGVPATHVEFNPRTGALTVDSPKQVTSKKFHATINNKEGTAEISWDDLSALNEPNVITSAGEADAARIDATSGLVKQIGDTVGQVGGTALKAAAKP